MCPIGFIDLPLPIFPSPYPLYSAFPSPAPSSQLSGRPPSLSPPLRFLVLFTWLIFAQFLTPLSSHEYLKGSYLDTTSILSSPTPPPPFLISFLTSMPSDLPVPPQPPSPLSSKLLQTFSLPSLMSAS